MRQNTLARWILFLACLAGWLYPTGGVLASQPYSSVAQSEVTAFDLIVAMNTQRASYGLPALIEDPVIDAVAQATADFMAASNMSSHIGNVSGRLAAAGYGGGPKVYGTENFAIGYYSIDEIMAVWADEAHMLSVVIPAYCNVGAGTAKAANGMTYYVFQAAYVAGKACGEYTSVGGSKTNPDGSTNTGRAGGVSQLIVPVKVAAPDADGKVYHVVAAGQSFWSIAVAYKITIKDLEVWNNLSKESSLLIGQKLFIPGPATKGFVTPTPMGMVITTTPGPDGKVVHAVQPYQTLSSIAQAYGVQVDAILALNRIDINTPLQIGQNLLIKPSNITPSPTRRPLTPIEKITPASDGKYYHTVKSGENLVWIADLYKVGLKDLMSWNGLKETSVLFPNQKLLLQITPPPTATPTPNSATATPTPALVLPTSTSTLPPTQSVVPLTPTATAADGGAPDAANPSIWFILMGVAVVGIFLIAFFTYKKQV